MDKIKPIPGFPGYFADDQGNVYSEKSGFRKKLKCGDTYRGYSCVGMRHESGRSITKKVHHVILESFVGPKPSDRHVARHLNDDGYDNRLCNLLWGTYKENIEDCKNNGSKSKYDRQIRGNITIKRQLLIKRLVDLKAFSKEEITLLIRCSETQLSKIISMR